MSEPQIPDALPLVLRPSRAGTIAAFVAGILFLLFAIFPLAVGNVLVSLFCFALAAVGLFAGVMVVLPKRSELRLDDQGLQVVSPVKSWKAGWSEIESFGVENVPMGRRGRGPVIKVVYRDGFEKSHAAETPLGKALGVDEHYVVTGYGNLHAEQLCALLSRFRERYGT